MSIDDIILKIDGRTLIDKSRLSILSELVKQYSDLPIAEVGVYKGGSAYLINSITKGLVFCIDTFEGMPETDKSIDWHNKGDFADTSYEDVSQFLSKFENCKVIKSNFNDAKHLLDGHTFGMVHLDVDIYSSTMDCLNYFYDKMVVGGVILLDDFKFETTHGCPKAVWEFLADKPEICIDLGTGQGLIIKQDICQKH
jgi:hypothetical protein